MDPSTVLPVELLQKIFQHYLSDREKTSPLTSPNPFQGQRPCGHWQTLQSFDLSDGLWVLGRVNSAWRKVTLSSKMLWSTVLITDYANLRIYSPSDSNILIEILTEILHRSGDAPLHISLSFPIKVGREKILSDSASRSLFALLSAQSHRWQWMDLKAPAMIWEDFARIPPSRLGMLRSLRTIVPSASFLVQIVGACLSVVDLMMYSPYLNDHYTLPPVHIGMPSLRYLVISSRHINVLEAIAAPYLQSLELRGYAYQPSMLSYHSVFTEFIQRSKCSNSLTTLNLYRTCDCRDFIAMFSRTPSTPRYTDWNRSKSVPSLLPNLHTLSYRDPRTLQAADVNLILDMIESRIAGRLRNVYIGYVNRADTQKWEGRLSSLNSLSDVHIVI
ncbi:uncharacterized protein ARMOST_00135 [Armillaria ostoyae]|uniref:F-box domain-containing protein n=1 Tax=Armillaria ostoyae TaxID=47428 RepID=A0A284QK98_ARMOS|nr:uncharacterized protein ARMOST_00135 [Armillaria ostoyae]